MKKLNRGNLLNGLLVVDCLYLNIGLDKIVQGDSDWVFGGMPEEEKKRAFEAAVQALVAEGRAAPAATLAQAAGYSDLAIATATIAYNKCCDRHQFEEATAITQKFGLPDPQEAAQEYLEKLLDDGNYEAAIRWSEKHNLPLPADSVEVYWSRHWDDLRATKLMTKWGTLDGAKLAISECLLAARSDSEQMLDYYCQPSQYFTLGEAIEDIGSVIGKCAFFSNWKLLQALMGMEDLGLEEARSAILGRAIAVLIGLQAETKSRGANKAPEIQLRKIVAQFVTAYCPELEDTTPEIARDVALCCAAQGQWPEFLLISKAWQFNDLLQRFEQLETLLPLPPGLLQSGGRLASVPSAY